MDSNYVRRKHASIMLTVAQSDVNYLNTHPSGAEVNDDELVLVGSESAVEFSLVLNFVNHCVMSCVVDLGLE